MKSVIIPILASAVGGAIGYWGMGEPDPASASSSTASQTTPRPSALSTSTIVESKPAPRNGNVLAAASATQPIAKSAPSAHSNIVPDHVGAVEKVSFVQATTTQPTTRSASSTFPDIVREHAVDSRKAKVDVATTTPPATRSVSSTPSDMAVDRVYTQPMASILQTSATQPTARSAAPTSIDIAFNHVELPPSDPIPGSAEASIDDNIRFVPTTRPTTPVAQRPPLADEKNVDTGKPVREWQRLTDDWFGARPWLDDHGVAIQASLTADYSKVFSGGTDTDDTAFRNLFNLTLTLDSERLLKWHGGTLFVNFQNQAGENGAELVGNLQGISNIDADGRTQISELWYEQVLVEDKVRLKAGKVDANGEFAHTPSADEFVNGAFAAAPTILAFPTYPDPATSFNVFVTPNDTFFASFGVYDGTTQTGRPTGDFGPARVFDGDPELFYIGETGLKWSTPNRLEGAFTIGGWHHTADFERFDGGTDSSASGAYVMFDQILWRENPGDQDDDQKLGLFVKWSYADPNVSPVWHHFAIGCAATGLIPDRDDDVLGVGVSVARLSDQANFAYHAETVCELFYRVRVNAWFSIKPDIQYIHNAVDSDRRDTVAGTLRMLIDF